MVNEFDAGLFHPELGNEVVRGKIVFDAESLRFRSDVANVVIPLGRLGAELDKDEGRIYLMDRGAPDIRIFSEDERVLDAWVSGRPAFIRKLLQQSLFRGEILRRLRLIGYVVAGCVLLGWLVSCATHLMVRSLVTRIPPEWEEQFGDEQIAELKAEGVLLDDTNRVQRLAAVAGPLLQVVPGGQHFQFHILQSDVPNAFALPGGHIVVNTGLLDMADSDELLGVIAHESAHITRKHHAREIISSAGPLIVCGVFLGSRNGLSRLLGEGAGLMLVQGFSQEYETEADEAGWDYLIQANVDPRGMIRMFRKFKAGEAAQKPADRLPEAFQSHPALDKRIARLEAKWKKLPRKTGFLQLEPTGRP
jgi:Zn-dependent protease with chaperone function